MEQNNFEKRVRKELEELKVTPSEAAWIHVEKKVRQNRRKKRAVFILSFMALFMALIGVYWVLDQSGKMRVNQLSETAPEIKSETVSTNQAGGKDFVKTDSALTPKKDMQDPIHVPSSEKKYGEPDTGLKHKIRYTSVDQMKSFKSEAFRTGEAPDTIPALAQRTPQMINTASFRAVNFADAKTRPVVDSGLVMTPPVFKSPFPTAPPVLAGRVDEIVLREHADSPPKPEDDSSRVRKWKWGISASGGQTYLGKVNPPSQATSDLMYYSPNFSSGSIPATPNTSLTVKRKNAMAFGTGVFVERNISHAASIALGIQYNYFSFINEVGSRIDSSQLVYSAGSFRHTYRNNLGFIELPVSLRLRLTPERTIPLFWRAGAAASMLIHSNALQLDVAERIYYVDNSAFRKMQLNLSTGFAAEVFRTKKFSLNAGPYLYFQPMQMARGGLYEQRRLVSYGLNAEIIFHTK